MDYTYDNRPPKTASDEDPEDALQDLIGLVGDALKPAETVVSELAKRTDTDLSDAQKHAKAIVDALGSAETVENKRDFVANILDAKRSVGFVNEALKKAKREAKEGEDTTALEAIDEALDALREVRRELASIQEEIDALTA